jgi:hypothetical protein
MEHCESCKEMNDGYCELLFDLQGYMRRGIPVLVIMESLRRM